MIIRKKPARPHALHEPIRHENHPRPISRRQLIGAGLMAGPAVVTAPAWLGMLLKASRAEAALDPDIAALRAPSQCNITTSGSGMIPFIAFDLAGGANLVGSEVLMGLKGGQMNFLSSAGYSKLGLPGNMLPTSPTFVSNALGLAWHSDGAILRGIMSKASAATQGAVNGAVIAAMSQNDTQNNPHNPMYGIAEAGARGSLLTLIGTESTVSGGNSLAPMAMINPTLQPTKISQASDDTGLVSSGAAVVTADDVAVLQSQARISSGTNAYNPASPATAFAGSKLGDVTVFTDPNADGTIKNQVRCQFVKSANTADVFGNPAVLNPDLDTNIVGATGIFTTAEYNGDSDLRKTAAVMKLVLNGFAAAGTITLGGYDYHDSTRATGEQRNFHAGVCIGAVLEYAKRVGTPVMIYVFSDGSLSSTGMADNSVNGRGKLGWQGDNQSTASTFFLAYSPKGRPGLRNGAASQQVGYFNTDGSVNTTSSPAANAVNLLVQTVILNYLGLHGLEGQFSTLFPMQGLGAPSSLDALLTLSPIV